jgi:hypothetical protein
VSLFLEQATKARDELFKRRHLLLRKQIPGPAESNSVCLAPYASRARRRVGD